MRRIALYVTVLLVLATTRAFADEKQDGKPTKQEPAAQAQNAQAQKDVKKTSPQVTETKKATEKATEKAKADQPALPKLDEDGLYQIEKNIVDYTNNERARRGLQPLEIDKTLINSARGQAIWMTRTRRLEHTRKPVGENIAMGYRTSKDVVRGWMNSKGHRANILNSGYRRIGVAAYKAKDGTIWWCQQFLR